MLAAELRDLQRPLKEQYRADASSAVIPAHARAVLDLDALSCTVGTSTGATVAGLHRAAGGSGELACSADLLLGALAACAGVTLASVATAMSVEIRSARVEASGHWDARGTLGVDKDVPVGMTDITLRFVVDTDADVETVSRLIDLTERYCVIAQTLASPPAVTVERAGVA
jgi:uncharacterized OsmC-like protein